MSGVITTRHVVIATVLAGLTLVLALNAQRTIGILQRVIDIRVPRLGCVEIEGILERYPYIVYINDSRETHVWGFIKKRLDGIPNSYQVENLDSGLSLTVTEMTAESMHTLTTLIEDPVRLDGLGGTRVSVQGNQGVLMKRTDGGFWVGIPSWKVEFSSSTELRRLDEFQVRDVGRCDL